MSEITIHVIDLASGKAAKGLNVLLEFLAPDGWQDLAHGLTDSDGRIKELLITDSALAAGIYRVSFDTKSYMQSIGKHRPYPYVPVVLEVNDTQDAYEISLMLSAYGYSSNIEKPSSIDCSSAAD
jgi:5-hydroxyisourate hydrolase